MTERDRPWLDRGAVKRLEPMLAMLAGEKASLSSVTDPKNARDVHLVDSLSGLIVKPLAEASIIADIGSGAGFPGIPLAVSLPESTVEMIESVKRKADFIDRVIKELGLDNAKAINLRTEQWAAEGEEGRERYDAVTARAVADLTVLCELASPLLEEGGVLVAWKGEREDGPEARLAGLEARLAMKLEAVLEVSPFATSRRRHLYLIRKSGPTPQDLPRRPGMARKRAL